MKRKINVLEILNVMIKVICIIGVVSAVIYMTSCSNDDECGLEPYCEQPAPVSSTLASTPVHND